MEFDAVLLPPRRARLIAQGLWHDRTINAELDACAAARPQQLALTAVQVETGDVRRFSYGEMAQMADRIAVGLARLGVGRGDVVACQLPNWWQFTLTYLACSRIGAVMNPLMHIFRERELSFMLNHGEAKVMIAPKTFRGFDFEAMVTGLQPSLPHLKHVVIVGGDGGNSFDALLSAPEWEKQADAQDILTRGRPGPDDVTQLIYTSGTTGEPKGVMHSANTVMANIIPYAERLKLDAEDVVLMASPMAHQTGFMYGLMMPILLKTSVVLQDIWEPKKALSLIQSERVTFTMASTPFLTDLARTVAEDVQAGGPGVPTLRVGVATDVAHHRSFMDSFMHTLWWVVLGASLATGLLGWFVARRGLAPLRAMGHRAAEVSAQRLDHRLPADTDARAAHTRQAIAAFVQVQSCAALQALAQARDIPLHTLPAAPQPRG
mgnify:CR=1 FL=1